MPRKPAGKCTGEIVVTHMMRSGRILTDEEFDREYHNKDKPLDFERNRAIYEKLENLFYEYEMARAVSE